MEYHPVHWDVKWNERTEGAEPRLPLRCGREAVFGATFAGKAGQEDFDDNLSWHRSVPLVYSLSHEHRADSAVKEA